MEYLHVFNSETDYNTARESNYKEPWVSATNIGGGGSTSSYRVNYNKSEEEKRLGTPLTFEITSAGKIVWKANNTAYTVTLEYSKDNGQNWTQITSNTGSSAPSISVSAGDTVQFRCGTDDGYTTTSSGYSRYNIFSGTTAGFKVNGNVMSLLNRNFASLDMLQSGYTFYQLFQYCTGLTDASKLIFPATTLANNCYSGMFYGCSSLTTAPELPATTLANQCYYDMFNNTNVLPDCSNIDFTSATVVASGGLQGLFSGTKVTDNDLRLILPTNPITNKYYLPVTTLASSCYQRMFGGCTGLSTAPELPATTLANSCYQYMFYGCTSLTTAPELPATTLLSFCYNNMFNGCRNLTTAPELPATTLKDYCYGGMFSGCTKLNYIKCLATNLNASHCTQVWISGVASTGTFVKSPNISEGTWGRGTDGIPTGWTVQDA